jgi:radical SAM protein (TIGR01212 family)
MVKRYRSFGFHMKELFGTTVHKVNVDAGFTCPNRDGTIGTSGCIYCNNDSFRPRSCTSTLPLSKQISNGISYVTKRYHAAKFLVYFQPYTNTYAPVKELERIYREALSVPSVIGLAIGTRPDAVDEEKISLLQSLAKHSFILVEYGMQSMYEKSLRFIKRGHTYRAFLDTLDMTKDRGIHIGAHIIVGFPTETRGEMLMMADEISGLPVNFLKIHQLQVIRNTPLEHMFHENPFPLFAYDEYIEFVAEFIERLSPQIVLQRLFATAPDSILVAPQWGRKTQEIIQDIIKELARKNSFQGKLLNDHAGIRT